ncbi:MAG: ACP S-malonyltransferase [Methylovulum sp.]|jgi:[acyl-carrier-protein] S-malonyltransferase|nr:ACP S-malonyltransferase [Methylovulum sp.]MCF7998198.1 ACP S-malonyltransferase [Methylovulum sp.]
MSNQIYNLAFVFPGQGSQSVGMLSDLASSYPEIKQTFEQASDVLSIDLWKIITDDPNKQLDQTQNTQPAMLAAGYAVWQLWCKLSLVRPAWMAGHSLGEYTSLVCAEALSFEQGIKLVAARARLMQNAIPEGVGAMAAILGLEDHQVVNLCTEVSGDEKVFAANFNAPGQVVVAGHVAAVERLMVAAKAAGAKRALLIPVSVLSHCPLMTAAAEELEYYLQETVVASPKITLIHNADVASHNSPKVIKNVLRDQLFKPVRWVDSIKFMNDQGVSCFVECGPGKVLLGLNKRIAKSAQHFALFDTETFNQLLEHING